MELYRSGHNEAVLKTVCPKGTWVRIPPAPPKLKSVSGNPCKLRVCEKLLNQKTGFNKHLTKVEIETRKMRPRNDDWIVNDPIVVFIPCPSITNFFGDIMIM